MPFERPTRPAEEPVFETEAAPRKPSVEEFVRTSATFNLEEYLKIQDFPPHLQESARDAVGCFRAEILELLKPATRAATLNASQELYLRNVLPQCFALEAMDYQKKVIRRRNFESILVISTYLNSLAP
jgi:hypothetical protein